MTGLRELTATSYVVLGLLAAYGPATSYELKKRAGATVGNFWIFAHSQLYDEPVRLAGRGHVIETTERAGRRRRTFDITEAGRDALRKWLASPTPGRTEVRDPGLLKLFFGGQGSPGDMAALARDQAQAHRQQAEYLEAIRDHVADRMDRWEGEALRLGIHFERTIESYWQDRLADYGDDGR